MVSRGIVLHASRETTAPKGECAISRVSYRTQPFDIAWLGPENPLPDMENVSYVHAPFHLDESLKEEDKTLMGYGRIPGILPYRLQDTYDRNRTRQEKSVILLENKHIRALFLPWMGGRLWSLEYQGRELLFHNPVVQPCNLALRNAWCAGGVEWNVGIRGHQMSTCAQLFTELIHLPDGTAGVRFYEYERIRGIVYRIEAYLPEDSHWLYVKNTMENPGEDTATYWWSNMAVPETPDMRVIAPAREALFSLYDDGVYRMVRKPIPHYEGMDMSRPESIYRSIDIFFDVPEDTPKFITALQPNGRGLAQISTKTLMGRKLFVWGMNTGGRHWQEFLSQPGEAYVEIQAGLARTQQEHIPFAAGETLSWLEAYGELACDVGTLAYPEAVQQVQQALTDLFLRLEQEAEGRAQALAGQEGETVTLGSGWGALENRRRQTLGEAPLSPVCAFPTASLTSAQAPWMALMEDGGFPEMDPLLPPMGYQIGPAWKELLQVAEVNWDQQNQLGVLHYALGDREGAKACFARSAACRENPWALRNLARLSLLAGEAAQAEALHERALRLLPSNRALFLEYGSLLLSMGRHEKLLKTLAERSFALPEEPRMELLKTAALIALGNYAEAQDILERPLVIPDIQEGELSLSALWFTLQQARHGITQEQARQAYPLPYALDFRMHE